MPTKPTGAKPKAAKPAAPKKTKPKSALKRLVGGLKAAPALPPPAASVSVAAKPTVPPQAPTAVARPVAPPAATSAAPRPKYVSRPKGSPPMHPTPTVTGADVTAAMTASRNTGWGAVAGWYDRLLGGETGTFQKEVILPSLLRLMAIKPGEHIADLACGQGFFAGAFTHAGATVVGADIAPELIARAKANAPGAEFHVAPATATPLKEASADQLTIILALQNIEDARGAMLEAARILKPGGRIHLVLNHPAFRIPKKTSWGWDKDMHQYRRVDAYLTEARAAIEMHPGADTRGATERTTTFSFHRPLQFYVKTLVRGGFRVVNLEEWISNKVSDSGPRAPEENRARREFPLFLYLEAIKQ